MSQSLEKLSPQERRRILEERLSNDTQEALTEEEKTFLRNELDWFYQDSMGAKDGARNIITRMEDAFVGAGRQHFWKQVAMVRIASELKEARRRFGNVQTMMSFEEVQKFLSAIEQLDGNIFADESDFGSAKVMGSVFTKEQIDWIRKMSGTGIFHMAREDFQVQGAYGAAEGLWKAFVYLLGNIAK